MKILIIIINRCLRAPKKTGAVSGFPQVGQVWTIFHHANLYFSTIDLVTENQIGIN